MSFFLRLSVYLHSVHLPRFFDLLNHFNTKWNICATTDRIGYPLIKTRIKKHQFELHKVHRKLKTFLLLEEGDMPNWIPVN